MESITSFQGKNRFLSNFWPAKIVVGDIKFSSVETAYQASKALHRSDREAISKMTPGQAKRAGRKVTLVTDWERIKVNVMHNLNTQKYQDPELARMLLATYPALLIEGNTWGDTFWGATTQNDKGPYGQNHLGQILMKIRAELKSRGSYD